MTCSSQTGKVVDLNCTEDYAIQVQASTSLDKNNGHLSQLDVLIQTVWQEKMQNGAFRYNLQHPIV